MSILSIMSILSRIHNRTATLADQEEALQNSRLACRFAANIKGADIEKCQEVACREPEWAYAFVRDVPGANIEYCQEFASRDPRWAYLFALYIPGANIKKCVEACNGSAWEDALNYFLMHQALL